MACIFYTEQCPVALRIKSNVKMSMADCYNVPVFNDSIIDSTYDAFEEVEMGGKPIRKGLTFLCLCLDEGCELYVAKLGIAVV